MVGAREVVSARLDLGRVGLLRVSFFLIQIHLAVCSECVGIGSDVSCHSVDHCLIVFIAGSLAVGSLFLNDELLARVGIDFVHLGQLLLPLLQLSLLLLILFESFLTLVGSQFTVRGSLGQTLRLVVARVALLLLNYVGLSLGTADCRSFDASADAARHLVANLAVN